MKDVREDVREGTSLLECQPRSLHAVLRKGGPVDGSETVMEPKAVEGCVLARCRVVECSASKDSPRQQIAQCVSEHTQNTQGECERPPFQAFCFIFDSERRHSDRPSGTLESATDQGGKILQDRPAVFHPVYRGRSPANTRS